MMDAPLHFSRIRLKRDSAEVAPLINTLLPDDEGQALNIAHRMLWTLMPDALRCQPQPDAPDTAAFLWREGEQRGTYYMLGPEPLPGNSYFTVDTQPYGLALAVGDRLAFELTVNATVNRKTGEGADGRAKRKRTDIVLDAMRAAEQSNGQRREQAGKSARAALRFPLAEQTMAAWLAAQGALHGFTLEEDCALHAYRTVSLRREGPRKQPRADLGIAEMRGTLAVTDPAAFARKVRLGFGRGKAFGCGLMLLARRRARLAWDDDDDA